MSKHFQLFYINVNEFTQDTLKSICNNAVGLHLQLFSHHSLSQRRYKQNSIFLEPSDACLHIFSRAQVRRALHTSYHKNFSYNVGDGGGEGGGYFIGKS